MIQNPISNFRKQPFNIGDSVVLISGGAYMTVVDFDVDGVVTCCWWVKQSPNKPCEITISAGALMLAPSNKKTANDGSNHT